MKRSWWKILLVLLVIGGGWWLVKYLSTPPPGRVIKDLGRDHVAVEVIDKTVYSSNPPTSGPHYEVPDKSGIYTDVQPVGELIHSLEHGYIEIHYNCNPLPTGTNSSTPSGELKKAPGGATNDSAECKTMIKQLEDIARSKKLFKMIVVPNPTLDTRIALAAWDHIDAFNDFDAKRINSFIDFYRDHGPEQTME